MGLMRLFLLATSTVLILAFSNNVFAEEASLPATYSTQMVPTGNDIGVSKITPASFFYFLKTVRENLEMKLALTPHVKLIRQLEFATRRLRETKSLVGNKEDLIQPTLERYWFYINSLSDKDLKDEEVRTRVKESLIVHLEVLEQIYDQVSNKNARLAIRSVINRISLRADLPMYAKIPACYFLQKESTSSALNQAEQVILKMRANDCLKVLRRL